MDYKIQYDLTVLDKISGISDYISNVLLSPVNAEKRVRAIFDDISKLKILPESYPSADKKIGKRLNQEFETHFNLIVSGKYLVFFLVDRETVVITHLIPTDSNYFELFS